MYVYDENDRIVLPGTIIRDFRGNEAEFIRATRPRMPGKSGKIVVKWPGTGRISEGQGEYYDTVFNLRVIGYPS